MIRTASEIDLPALLEMGARFFAASGYGGITSFDRGTFRSTLNSLMRDGVLLVAAKHFGIVGMAGAVVYPFYFNAGHTTAQEMFWWVDEEHRGIGSKLFDAMVQAVKDRGAKSLSMIALDALQPEKVGAFYERKGFRPSERSFIGVL